jgi:hypothetical protein
VKILKIGKISRKDKLNMKKLEIPEKEILYKLYIKDGLSLVNIATIFNASAMTVRAWLINYGIKTRTSFMTLYDELKLVDFNDEQKSLLVGSILGDGGLRIPKRGKNAHFYESHCEKQLQYLIWKKNKLKPFTQSVVQKEIGGDHIISGVKCVVQNSYKFTTIAHTYLTELWKMFYTGNGNKVIPLNIDEYLNQFVIAIWICDDGSLVWNSIKRDYRLYFYTDGFTYDEQVVLCRALSIYFKGTIRIYKRKRISGIQYYITLSGKKELHEFCLKLINLVPDCMKYKFTTHI